MDSTNRSSTSHDNQLLTSRREELASLPIRRRGSRIRKRPQRYLEEVLQNPENQFYFSTDDPNITLCDLDEDPHTYEKWMEQREEDREIEGAYWSDKEELKSDDSMCDFIVSDSDSDCDDEKERPALDEEKSVASDSDADFEDGSTEEVDEESDDDNPSSADTDDEELYYGQSDTSLARTSSYEALPSSYTPGRQRPVVIVVVPPARRRYPSPPPSPP